MGKILKAYNLGTLGIDLVNSPLHVADTSFLNCQNAQSSPNDQELAVCKRDGMDKLNASVAAGTILAVINIQVADS